MAEPSRWWSAVLVLCVVLSACTGQPDDETVDRVPLRPERTELEKVIGVFDSDGLTRRVFERSVQVCMDAKGYRWSIGPAERQYLDPDSEGRDIYSSEWTEVYGLGISTQALPVGLVSGADEVDLVGFVASDFVSQAVADEADGETVESDPAEYGEALRAENGGCLAIAQGEAGSMDPDLVALQADLDDLERSILADAELLAAEEETAACMRNSGWSYTNRMAGLGEFEVMTSELVDSVGGIAMIETMSDSELDALSGPELETLLAQESSLDDEVAMSLAQLQDREVGFAADLNDCGGGLAAETRLSQAYWDARSRYEQAFLAENPGLGDLAEAHGLRP